MNKLFLTLILFLPLVLSSCSDDNKEEIITNKTYKIRYEASCDVPGTMLRILYTTKNTDMQNVQNDAKEVFIKSPFSAELEMKSSELCYISVQQHLGEDTEVLENASFTSSIFVDGVKKTETTNKAVSLSYLLLDF